MDIESYLFTLLAAISGMIVVFVILAMLSGMMLIMARVISPTAPTKKRQGLAGGQELPPTMQHREVIALVVVAAAAHLHRVAEEERQSAASWHPQSELSPWSMR